MAKNPLLRLFLLSFLGGFLWTSAGLWAQDKAEYRSHRIVDAQEIRDAGYDQFRLVLHYLMPDVFPRTVEAWTARTSDFTVYVDKNRLEPECLDDLDPRRVKKITVWEKGWDIMPMDLPSLAPSRYVVSIETI